MRAGGLIGWVVALAVAGCGGPPGRADLPDGAPDPDAAAPMTDAAPPVDAGGEATLDAARYLDRFFDSLCGWFVRCEPKLGAVAFGETTCHPARRAEIRAGFLDAVAAGTADFAPALGEACLASLARAECNVASPDLDGCDAAFVGRSLGGEPCATEVDCREGVCALGATCPGTCVARALGEACDDAAVCRAGATCRDGLCAARVAAGASCTRRTDCEVGLLCGSDGTCAPPLAAGAPCAAGLGGDPCAGDLVCLDGVCGTGGAVGEPCGGSAPCAPGGRCDGVACVPTAVSSAACVPNGCVALHACVDDACRPLPVAGEACDDALPCIEGACREGVCLALADGEPCEADVQLGECEGRCAASVCAPALAEGERCARRADCDPHLSCREADGPPRCLPSCGRE